MRLVSDSGELVPVKGREWPLSGLVSPHQSGNGYNVIPLATRPGGPPNYATYARIYRENPWVYAAVNAIAYGLSRMKIVTYSLDANGDREPVRGDLPGSTGRPNAGQSLDRLMKMPEPGVGRHEWVRKLMLDRLVYGNALATMDRSMSSAPSYLWHVPWRRVRVHEGEQVPILGYEIEGVKGQRFFDVGEVLHLGRHGDLDTPVGLSPLAPLKYTIALHDALQRHLNAYFQNAARPSGILKVLPGTSKDAQALIQEQVRKLYASPDQAGKIMVTSAEWQSLSDAPDSAQIIELAKLSREEIAGAYQVPPPVLGILDRAIKSNVAELRSQFVRDVIGPHADAFEDDVNAQVLGQNPGWRYNFVEFDLDSPLRPDLEARATVYEKMRHVWTVNEQRQLEGRKPLDGAAGEYADTVWMPSGQIPLGLRQPQENADPSSPQPVGSKADKPVANPADAQKAVDASSGSK
jgi:HK97 family phage portal protein